MKRTRTGGEGDAEAGTSARKLVACEDLSREEGEIRCTLRVVLGDDAAPDQPQDPACWTLRVAAGPVAIPTSRIPSEADA